MSLPSAGDGLRVLVVDDEPLLRWAIAQTLLAAGHVVSEFDSAATAVRAVRDGAAPDVIVIDCRFPDTTGLTLLGTLRVLAPNAAVIFMTAFGSPEAAAAARTLGIDHVLSKPFDMSELPHLVREAHASA